MKKGRQLLLAAALTGVLLSGCANSGSGKFTPAANCVYVAKDGSVSSALVKEYGNEEVEEKDLKQYLEAAVIRYNKENGGAEAASNKSGDSRLPAAIQSVNVKNGVMTAIFDYASVEDLAKFRQTNDNADDSNTITAIEVKKVADADAAGWLTEKKLLSPDGADADANAAKADAENMAISIEGGGTVRLDGKVLFMSEGVERQDEYTVTVPEDGKSVVVFK